MLLPPASATRLESATRPGWETWAAGFFSRKNEGAGEGSCQPVGTVGSHPGSRGSDIAMVERQRGSESDCTGSDVIGLSNSDLPAPSPSSRVGAPPFWKDQELPPVGSEQSL